MFSTSATLCHCPLPRSPFIQPNRVSTACSACPQELLKSASVEDAYAFVDSNSHPRLWRNLAEHALEGLDFTTADKAFVRCEDYQVRLGMRALLGCMQYNPALPKLGSRQGCSVVWVASPNCEA